MEVQIMKGLCNSVTLKSAVLSGLIICSSAFACGNMVTQEPINYHQEEKTLLDGTTYTLVSSTDVPYGTSFPSEVTQDFKKSVNRLEGLYKQTNNIDYLSDKGLVLMYLGKYDEAKNTFLTIEAISPNRYATAANLGTTYELLGNNKDALKWIKKAVSINPKSHENSEWIHVNILKAKLQGSEFETAENILKTDFGTEKLPKSSLSQQELKALHEQLLFQLTERVHFIKPTDKIIGELTYALANTAFLLKKYSGASYNYDLAMEYGYESPVAYSRYKESIKKAEKQYYIKQKYKNTGLNIILFGVLFVIFCIVCIWLKQMFQRIRKKQREVQD